jgi:hypothetical protein
MNGFICAEVMAFADFKEHGSESAVKAAGKYRQEGKNYTVVDGDIMFFKVPLPPASLVTVVVPLLLTPPSPNQPTTRPTPAVVWARRSKSSVHPGGPLLRVACPRPAPPSSPTKKNCPLRLAFYFIFFYFC